MSLLLLKVDIRICIDWKGIHGYWHLLREFHIIPGISWVFVRMWLGITVLHCPQTAADYTWCSFLLVCTSCFFSSYQASELGDVATHSDVFELYLSKLLYTSRRLAFLADVEGCAEVKSGFRRNQVGKLSRV